MPFVYGPFVHWTCCEGLARWKKRVVFFLREGFFWASKLSYRTTKRRRVGRKRPFCPPDNPPRNKPINFSVATLMLYPRVKNRALSATAYERI